MNGYVTLYKKQGIQVQHGRYPKPDIEGVNKPGLHSHTLCELLFILNGKGHVHVEGSKYELRPGCFFLMRPGEAHYIVLDPSVTYDRATVHFDPAILDSLDSSRSLMRPYLERESGKYNRFRPSEYGDTQCADWFKSILEQPERINIAINLMCILRKLCQFYDIASRQAVQETLEYQIMRYIQEHSREELSPQQLCSKFYISRTQLYRRFKAATGTSVSEYITLRRVLQARELIRQGYKPTQCYSLAGFSDYSTFYRAYQKHLGCSPRQTAETPEP